MSDERAEHPPVEAISLDRARRRRELRNPPPEGKDWWPDWTQGARYSSTVAERSLDGQEEGSVGP